MTQWVEGITLCKHSTYSKKKKVYQSGRSSYIRESAEASLPVLECLDLGARAAPGLYAAEGEEERSHSPRQKASLPHNEQHLLFPVGTQSVRVLTATIRRSWVDINILSIYLQLNPTLTGWPLNWRTWLETAGQWAPMVKVYVSIPVCVSVCSAIKYFTIYL